MQVMLMPSLQAVVQPPAVKNWQKSAIPQVKRTPAAQFFVIVCFKFLIKSTSLRHMQKQTIPLKLQQLQGYTHTYYCL